MPPMRGNGGGVNAWAAAHTVSAVVAASAADHLRSGLWNIISPRRSMVRLDGVEVLCDAADRRRAQVRAVTVLVVSRARAGASASQRFDDRMHVCNVGPWGPVAILAACVLTSIASQRKLAARAALSAIADGSASHSADNAAAG